MTIIIYANTDVGCSSNNLMRCSSWHEFKRRHIEHFPHSLKHFEVALITFHISSDKIMPFCWLIEDSKLVPRCEWLFIPLCSATGWESVHGVPCLSPKVSWERLQRTHDLSELKRDGVLRMVGGHSHRLHYLNTNINNFPVRNVLCLRCALMVF